jgi:PASTA domain-containing protein
MRQALIAVVALAVLIAVPGAQADEMPNAVYVGTHSGGGTVEFHVNAAGTAVDYIKVTDLPGTFCPGTKEDWGNFPIVNHTFDEQEPPEPTFFRGTFGADDTASGTLRYTNSVNCDTGVLTWAAKVAVPPPPLPPPPHPPPHCHVPNVVGKTLATARRIIRQARCYVGRVKKVYSTRAQRGRVLSQRPRPGKSQMKMTLVVGLGPRPRRP